MAAISAMLHSSEAVAENRHGLGERTSEPKRFTATAHGLGWLDRRFGSAWSIRSLRTCLSLALVSCWIAYFLGWGLGGSGRLGDVRLLASPDQPARLASAMSAIAFPLFAILFGRTLGRLERRAKLKWVRWRRRNPKQFRARLRLHDFERRYRWVLGFVFGAALITALIWFRRGDVAAFAVVFSWLALGPVSGIAVARRFSNPASQGVAALLAGFGSITGAVLLILAFAGAGVSAFAFAILGVTNVAFTGAIGVLLDIVMGGVFTLGLALAGAGVATVALALAGAGTGIATLTGVATMSRAGLAAFFILMSGAAAATLAFKEAAVLSAAIGGISALAVAATVAHNRMGHHGAYAGAIGSIALLTITAVLFGWGDKGLYPLEDTDNLGPVLGQKYREGVDGRIGQVNFQIAVPDKCGQAVGGIQHLVIGFGLFFDQELLVQFNAISNHHILGNHGHSAHSFGLPGFLTDWLLF